MNLYHKSSHKNLGMLAILVFSSIESMTKNKWKNNSD